TVVNQGTLATTAANALPANASVTLGDATHSAALDLSGTNQTVAAITTGAMGSANLIGNSSTTSNATLTFAGSGTTTLDATIQDVLDGGNKTQALTVNTGTLVLTANNTYTGGTNIAAGAMLRFGTGGTTGSISLANVNNNGVLSMNRNDTINLTSNITGT